MRKTVHVIFSTTVPPGACHPKATPAGVPLRPMDQEMEFWHGASWGARWRRDSRHCQHFEKQSVGTEEQGRATSGANHRAHGAGFSIVPWTATDKNTNEEETRQTVGYLKSSCSQNNNQGTQLNINKQTNVPYCINFQEKSVADSSTCLCFISPPHPAPSHLCNSWPVDCTHAW